MSGEFMRCDEVRADAAIEPNVKVLSTSPAEMVCLSLLASTVPDSVLQSSVGMPYSSDEMVP